jgi:hypothetical protein
LGGKQERKIPLRRPRSKLEGIIKTDLIEIGWGYGWINLAQERDQ